MTLAAGDYFPSAEIMYYKAATTVAIAKGALLKNDNTNDGWVACSAGTTEYGPFAVCVEAMATGGTQVKVCTRGKVAAVGAGVIEPGDLLQASSSTAGRVAVYAARTINVTTASTEWRRPVGQYISDSEDLGDGTIAVDSAAADVVIINLGKTQ